MVGIEEDKLSLKVLVHKDRNKVIFAEADGNFVNALFSIMALPLGTIVRVLEKCPDQNLKAIGSLKNLYQSLVELPADCFYTEEGKFMMLNPRTSVYQYDSCRNLNLNIDDTEPTKYFWCENERCNQPYNSYFSTCSVAKCLKCRKLMTREIKFDIDEYLNDGVFVPNAATFLVTDDLHVMPNTLDLSLGLLFSLGFTGASHVEERTIVLGRQQALVRGQLMLILVKAALLLKYPLTYLVFHDIHPIRGSVNPRLGTSIQHLTSDKTMEKNSKTMTLKLTFQQSTSKFLFAEAEQDFVDFVFGFLEIPLGTLIGKLTNGDTSFECLENLHASIANMNSIDLHKTRHWLIDPKLKWKHISVNQIFPLHSSNPQKTHERYFLDGILTKHAHGLGDAKYIMIFKDPRIGGAFLEATATYMVTDDLVVTRFSSVSAIGMMNKLKVPLKDIEHHVVTIDFEKALKILKASLRSCSTLTDVFLKEIIEKKKRDNEEFRSLSQNHERPNMDQIIRSKRKKSKIMAAKENKISLKLMVHKEKRKVVFAEADNNFVETLFSIMTLPMATIVRLFDKCPDQDFGSLKNLYRSLEELPSCYFFNEESKFMMLHPRTSAYKLCRKLKVKIEDPEPLKYFVCENPRLYFGTSRFARCPSCRELMNREVQYYENLFFVFGTVDDCDDPDVFLPRLATFIVTDDLNVMPNTLDFSVRLLCDLGYTDSSQELEEMTFDIGPEQMVILVKAALLFKNPLTYLVFHSIHPSGVLVNSKPATLIQHVITNKKSTNSKTMALRVALQKSTSKFLFAEAEEDFVDFIFGFLEIPLGTLIGKLMNGNTSFECLDNLFASISNMSVGRCIKSKYCKDLLIKPEIELKYVSINQIFPLDVSKCFETSLECGNMKLEDPRVEGRFLKPPTKFMLTDDLVITPLSSISGISMLTKLKVPLGDVEHHVVTIGIEEGLKILKASMKSNSTFTDAFT
ncbi:hypothetical protein OSB04_015035 [Centaurea solstitialis]|uniref:DUF674 family protein n=1 Tax=Centaurea solstitialis TaxID=347529 RepID=A0AA38TA74_9ASTR|nr:hypothetical protein OSB04_015035 [Centaurea solstitialis]